MSLLEKINSDYKEAMKAKNQLELSVLRLLKSAIKNKEIELLHSLSEDELLSVIRTMVKQGKDALVDFTKDNRQDLIEHQEQELQILQKYLPQPLSSDELQEICQKVLTELKITSMKDFGKAMGAIVKKVEGRADGNQIKDIVQKILN